MTKKFDIKKITVMAMLCAVAYLCMFVFKFKVSFLTFDLKDAILAVIAFMFGPVCGLISAVVVAFFEFISVSDTGIYGLIMNSLSSGTFAVVIGCIYKFKRTLLGAVFATVAAVGTMTAVMLIANIIITPFYMGVERQDVIRLLPTLFLPFNLCKGLVNGSLTMIIYKPVTKALKKSRLVPAATENAAVKINAVPVIALSAVVLAAAAAVIIFVLNGSFSIIQHNG